MDIYSSNWSETDASNTTAAPDGAPEGMAPGGVNNVLRANMGAIKRYVNQTIPITTAGTASAYTVSYSVTPGALVTGMTHLVEFHAANTASATLDINALGAKPLHILKPAGWGVLPVSTVVADMVCRVAYHATSGAYRLIEGPISAVLSTATSGYTVGPCSLRKQWGQVSATSAGNTAVTFPLAFSALPQVINLTPLSASGTVTDLPYATNGTAAGFTIVNHTASFSLPVLWSAEGLA